MTEHNFYPEGVKAQNSYSPLILEKAMQNKNILQAKVMLCDNAHNLILDLDGIKGIIPKTETAFGIIEGTTREIAIITRVNRYVSFTVQKLQKDAQGRTEALLSRRARRKKSALII